MNYNNKYYFLSTDIFSTLRIYVFTTLFIISIFVVINLNIWLAVIATSSLLAIKLIFDIGYIYVDHYTNKIIIRNLFRNISIKNIQPIEYWWNYDFQESDLENDQKSNSRSNKVIVNLVLKNDTKRIRFKESIRLDTRHPNDTIHLEKFNTKNTYTISIQRVDKLMTFLESNLKNDQFSIEDRYLKL